MKNIYKKRNKKTAKKSKAKNVKQPRSATMCVVSRHPLDPYDFGMPILLGRI